jgi:chorismate mutase
MSLGSLREKIDGIDARIIELLNLRFRYALRTRKHKMGTRDPERERSILRRVRSLALPPAGPDVLARIYRKILAESRNLQEKE